MYYKVTIITVDRNNLLSNKEDQMKIYNKIKFRKKKMIVNKRKIYMTNFRLNYLV